MRILVINCGSSSVKLKLFQIVDGAYLVLAVGLVEKIAEGNSLIHFHGRKKVINREQPVSSHHEALEIIETMLFEQRLLSDFTELEVAVHRVVHGGAVFSQPVIISESVIEAIRSLVPLAPLHNPYNLEGIMALKQKAPEMDQVAVFDTAFHQTMAAVSYIYALPYEFYQVKKIRRYGFHGISHHYLVKAASRLLGKSVAELNVISLHLGNGASITAVENGLSVDTSMGMTPMEGLVMGTRSGDVDPGILIYLQREYGLDKAVIDDILNKQSGLKGICGQNDMREILQLVESGDQQAKLAFNIFCRRVKKYIGAYLALLGRVDGLIFSGGMGEKSPQIREAICAGLEPLGIKLNLEKNRRVIGAIDCLDDGTRPVRVLCIPTDEELEMARQARELLVNKGGAAN